MRVWLVIEGVEHEYEEVLAAYDNAEAAEAHRAARAEQMAAYAPIYYRIDEHEVSTAFASGGAAETQP